MDVPLPFIGYSSAAASQPCRSVKRHRRSLDVGRPILIVAIDKDDGGAIAEAGEIVAYTVAVMNVGNQDATGVVVTDTLPEQVSFEAAESDPGWSCSGSIPEPPETAT